MQHIKRTIALKKRVSILIIIGAALCFQGCTLSAENEEAAAKPLELLPVITVKNIPAVTYQEFSASLEGSKVIALRPQVDGYLDKIYVDEGAYVKKDQLLFQINDRPYQEQLRTAQADLAAAKANLAGAEINLSKITPLVENNVVSDVQLKTAQAVYDGAAAKVEQAKAMVERASINLGYTLIKSPVDGYIGRIPFKTGSLVGIATPEPLTIISEIKEIYAYFSVSETDFIQFKNQFPGRTMEDKLAQLPFVELVLADNSNYPQKGKIEMVSGQFNNSMGSISFRAMFENAAGVLRSGNTGKIRIPRSMAATLVIPQEATFELQDKVFVFVVNDSNKVTSKPITVVGNSGNYYLVEQGLKPGDKIVYAGLDRLKDGAVIKPAPISIDSLIRVRPL